jgi:polyisoprenoid-binding protein YceI
MKSKSMILIGAASLFFAACENPADKTTSATVREAVQVTAQQPAAGGVKYVFSPSSEILFVGSKVTGSHTGGFKKFSGSFTVADNALVGTGQKITIDMTSLFSDDAKLTEHLKSADFMNVEKHPEATFELSGLKSVAEGEFEVSGNLTLNAVTKNLTFPATASVTDGKAKIHAKFDLNRKDFGIVYAGMPDDLIRDEVVIELKLEAAPEA